jgi:hypothetical protein
LPAYIIAALQGIYRYDKFLNNHELNIYHSLKKLKDPVKEINANKQYVVYAIPCRFVYHIGVSWIDRRLRTIGLRPYKCRQMNGGESIVGGEELERRRDYKRLFSLQPFRGSEL